MASHAVRLPLPGLTMGRLFALSVILFVAPHLIISKALGDDDEQEHSDRVLKGRDLSDHEHYDGGEHDADYDHDAFLGHDEAEEFEHLSPEESMQRLSKIVDRIDKDEDGYVTFDEMRAWIQFTQRRYVAEDVDRQWQQHNREDGDALTWQSYRDLVYGFLDEEEREGNRVDEEDEHVSYKKMEDRDRRRFDLADEDKSGTLSKDEFTNFLHPEEAEHMRDVVVQETLEDIDKDGDGLISLQEYIGDMYRGDGGEETEPDWVKHERAQFEEHRDKNGDGLMDLDEVRDWIIPADFDHSEAEAKHLIFEADADQDLKLSKDEILEKYDLFVGSQATDFGEALTRHDEF